MSKDDAIGDPRDFRVPDGAFGEGNDPKQIDAAAIVPDELVAFGKPLGGDAGDAPRSVPFPSGYNDPQVMQWLSNAKASGRYIVYVGSIQPRPGGNKIDLHRIQNQFPAEDLTQHVGVDGQDSPGLLQLIEKDVARLIAEATPRPPAPENVG